MLPPSFLDLDTPEGRVRLAVETTSEAGLTLVAPPHLTAAHLGMDPGREHPAVLVVPSQDDAPPQQYHVRVRLAGFGGAGAPLEVAFAAMTPALRERLRVSVTEPVEVGTLAFALAEAAPSPSTLLPNGRRLLLPSSGAVYEHTLSRRASRPATPLPPLSPAVRPPRLWLRAVVPALTLGVAVLGLALLVAVSMALVS